MSLRRRMRRYRERLPRMSDLAGARAGGCTAAEPTAWMSEEEFLRRPAAKGKEALHTTMCFRTGEMFVRPLDGRFRGLPREELEARIAEISGALEAMGGRPVADRALALHQQLEYLDNILDFEVTQPCGCSREAARAPMAEA